MAPKSVENLTSLVRNVSPRKARAPQKKPVRLEEVQTELMRLEGRFSNRMEQALDRLEAEGPAELRKLALNRRLAYASSALDIAVGPNPELNLFDMIAFLEVSLSALKAHWIPQYFGQQDTAPILAAFQTSLAESWQIADTLINPSQRSELSSFIAHWIEEHPDHRTLDTLRFSRYSEPDEQTLPDSKSGGIRGLVQHATRAFAAADATRLLAERAFYYTQRIPFLLRLQARVATRELITEGFRALRPVPLIAITLCLYFPLRAVLRRRRHP